MIPPPDRIADVAGRGDQSMLKESLSLSLQWAQSPTALQRAMSPSKEVKGRLTHVPFVTGTAVLIWPAPCSPPFLKITAVCDHLPPDV
ncbi:unnamed protein product [Linum trigynum]|uniref:Uncharacterized protein n=1 Tax=Linum trigynum TaxID=586398 RepID=A0AAV2ELQ4_9ROSI